MHSNIHYGSPEVQDVLDQAFPVSLEVERHLKTAIDALKWLQNSQHSFHQS